MTTPSPLLSRPFQGGEYILSRPPTLIVESENHESHSLSCDLSSTVRRTGRYSSGIGLGSRRGGRCPVHVSGPAKSRKDDRVRSGPCKRARRADGPRGEIRAEPMGRVSTRS